MSSYYGQVAGKYYPKPPVVRMLLSSGDLYLGGNAQICIYKSTDLFLPTA